MDDLLDDVKDKYSSDSSKGGSNSEEGKSKKSKSSGGTEKSKASGDAKMDLFAAVAKVYHLTRSLEDAFEDRDVSKKREKEWKKTARGIHETAFEHFGIHGGHQIASKYGLDWQEMIGQMRVAGGNDKDLEKDDAKTLIKIMANAQIKSEGITRKEAEDIEEGKGREKKKVRLIAAKKIYDDITGVMAKHNVQKHAERFGIDYEEDIIKDILENQADEIDDMMESENFV